MWIVRGCRVKRVENIPRVATSKKEHTSILFSRKTLREIDGRRIPDGIEEGFCRPKGWMCHGYRGGAAMLMGSDAMGLSAQHGETISRPRQWSSFIREISVCLRAMGSTAKNPSFEIQWTHGSTEMGLRAAQQVGNRSA